MTQDHFNNLKRSVYYQGMEPEWNDLIAKYNKAKGTNLSSELRSNRLLVLQAIALKQGFNFQAKDLHFECCPETEELCGKIQTNYEMREFWEQKNRFIKSLSK